MVNNNCLGAQFGEQVLGMDGFSQDFEFVTLGASGFQQVGSGRLSGKQQDLAGGQEGTNVDGGLNTVHVGHDDVTDDKVGAVGAGALDSGAARVDGGSIVAVLVEDDGQSVGNHAFVIHYQDLGSGLLNS